MIRVKNVEKVGMIGNLVELRFDFDYVPEGRTETANCRIYYFFDDVGKQLICIGFAQSTDSEYDYFSDIEKMVDGMSK